MLEKIDEDGLFSPPYGSHDWIIIALAVSGYLFRMYLLYTSSKQVSFKDWFGIGMLTLICTVSLYEMVIYEKWDVRGVYLYFAIAIILAKDITDWLFIGDDGKKFVLSIFKGAIDKLLSSFGYERKEDEKEN